MSKENVIIDESKPTNSVGKSNENGKKSGKIDFDSLKSQPAKKPDIGVSQIDDFLADDYKEKAQIIADTEPEESPKKSKKRKSKTAMEDITISGEIITGAMFISLIDLVLPLIIVTANNTIDKKNKIKIDQLRLKAAQKKELEPVADELVKQLELKANPVYVFIISLISVYGLNFVNVKYGLD